MKKVLVRFAYALALFSGPASAVPIVDFLAGPSPSSAAQTVSFVPASTFDDEGFGLVSFEWFFGDGSDVLPSLTADVVDHLFLHADTYEVGLRVTNTAGGVGCRVKSHNVGLSGGGLGTTLDSTDCDAATFGAAVAVTSVPEPTTLALLGLTGLLVHGRNSRSRQRPLSL